MPTAVTIDSPASASASTPAAGGQQTPVVAEASLKRSARNTAKEVNYRELANGPPRRLKRDPNSTAREYKRTRTPSSNTTSASGESGLSISNNSALECSGRSQEALTGVADDGACKPVMANHHQQDSNGHRLTTGGKSPLLIAELKENLRKLDVDKDRSSSLSPAPEDLEDPPTVGNVTPDTTGDFKKVPGVSFHIKQYTYETPASKLKFKETKAQNASADVDIPMVNGLDTMVPLCP